jgi:tetratricopeptide (TPR) repeat protein
VDRRTIDTAAEMLRLFTYAEAATGAGHLRPALSLYLADNIAPSLHASAAGIRAELLRVSAWLTHLCGLMCYDDELHGFAQRYLRLAMWLSAEAGTTGPQALVLRAMSGQALALGYCGHALSLAERAVAVADPALPPPARASLLAQLAMARAGTGDRRGAMTAIDTAQTQLGRNPAEAGEADAHYALGTYHDSALAHQRGIMLALLGERSSAITELQYSIRHRPSLERRSRAITLTRLASLQLRQGHIEQAVETWHHFLDDYPTINSGRARTALVSLPTQFRPHKRVPAAGALLTRAIALQRLPYVARDLRTIAALPPQDMETRPQRAVQARWDRPFTSFCDGCGTPLDSNPAERHRRHCGPACRQRAYGRRKPSRRP